MIKVVRMDEDRLLKQVMLEVIKLGTLGSLAVLTNQRFSLKYYFRENLWLVIFAREP